ncbi:TPA: hypothetical protein ACIVON_005432, partial [Salmonella enterica subsp. enterica serovar Poona]
VTHPVTFGCSLLLASATFHPVSRTSWRLFNGLTWGLSCGGFSINSDIRVYPKISRFMWSYLLAEAEKMQA